MAFCLWNARSCRWLPDAHSWAKVAAEIASSSYDYITFNLWEGETMGETFGGYTRWAVVFLIIFVLFILLVPYGGTAY